MTDADELAAANERLARLRTEWAAHEKRSRYGRVLREGENNAWVKRSGRLDPEDIKPVMKRSLKQSGLDWAMREREIFGAWSASVGEEVATATRLLSFRNGILVIEVYNNALRQELAGFQKEGILLALREAIPDRVIRDIRFKLGERKTND